RELEAQAAPASSTARESGNEARARRQPKKLSYKDQRELDALPDQIDNLTEALDALRAQVADPGFYKQDYDAAVAPVLAEVAAAEAALDTATERWLELESLRESLETR
ncbi:MAG: ABC transporter ATP-binding protein, partial [Pseudomonadota bacterium]